MKILCQNDSQKGKGETKVGLRCLPSETCKLRMFSTEGETSQCNRKGNIEIIQMKDEAKVNVGFRSRKSRSFPANCE